MIYVNVDDMEHVTEVQKAITDMGYEGLQQHAVARTGPAADGYDPAVLGGIGAVSLFVAAIGIANTMMMSIYEKVEGDRCAEGFGMCAWRYPDDVFDGGRIYRIYRRRSGTWLKLQRLRCDQ